MDLKEIYVSTGNWVNSAQDRDYWRAHVNAPWRYSNNVQKLVMKMNYNGLVGFCSPR